MQISFQVFLHFLFRFQIHDTTDYKGNEFNKHKKKQSFYSFYTDFYIKKKHFNLEKQWILILKEKKQIKTLLSDK